MDLGEEVGDGLEILFHLAVVLGDIDILCFDLIILQQGPYFVQEVDGRLDQLQEEAQDLHLISLLTFFSEARNSMQFLTL